MPASGLVACLDRATDFGPLFAQALSCVAEVAVVR
jgi:hypothetical protein